MRVSVRWRRGATARTTTARSPAVVADPVIAQEIARRRPEFFFVCHDERTAAFHEHQRFVRVPVFRAEQHRDAVDGSLEDIVDPLAETAADVGELCARIQHEQDADAVDDDHILSVIFIQRREADGRCLPASSRSIPSMCSRVGSCGDEDEQQVRPFFAEPEERREQHFFVLGPGAAGDDHLLAGDHRGRNDMALACFGTPGGDLIVPRVADGFDHRPASTGMSGMPRRRSPRPSGCCRCCCRPTDASNGGAAGGGACGGSWWRWR